MSKDQHKDVLAAVTKQFSGLYNESEQAMYIFLDDQHKSCNERFARLLGYKSAAEWAAVQTSFTSAFVDPGSQAALVGSYQDAMEKGVAANTPVTWKRKDGKTIETDVVLVPVEHEGHRLAVHFIRN